MSRLTGLQSNGKDYRFERQFVKGSVLSDEECLQNIANKLGQKENDDEELGIDSHILFQALRNGIYVAYTISRENDSYYELEFGKCSNAKIIFIDSWRIKIADLTEFEIRLEDNHYEEINFADYGKTWALTREELEK